MKCVEEAVKNLAIDIKLQLHRSGVPDADRLGVLVSGKPVDLPLHQLTLTFEAIHNLNLVGAAGKSAEEPLLPGVGLFEVACIGKCEQGERRVAEPAKTVVPVARAANKLGQRGRDSSDNTTRRTKRQSLESNETAFDGLAIGTTMFESAAPVAPELLGRPESLLRTDLARVCFKRPTISQ